jgi:hypothetical protein
MAGQVVLLEVEVSDLDVGWKHDDTYQEHPRRAIALIPHAVHHRG